MAISLDGVLRKSLDEHAQDVGGTLLYASLIDHFRVVVLGGLEEDKDTHFLKINGMGKHVKLEPQRLEDAPTEAGRKRAQLFRLKAQGFVFEFVVVPDPELAKQLYQSGFTVLMYLHPQYSAKAWRPDHVGGVRAWNELEAEVDYQLTTKADQREKAVQQ